MAGISKTYDHSLLLEDGGTITSSAAGEVGGVAKILDLGAGKVEGDVIVDVSVLDVNNGDEVVTLSIQISSSSTFASDIYQVASLNIGDAVPLASLSGSQADADMTTGRYVIPFNNMIADGTTKRYMRLYRTLAGTIASFVATAYFAKRS